MLQQHKYLTWFGFRLFSHALLLTQFKELSNGNYFNTLKCLIKGKSLRFCLFYSYFYQTFKNLFFFVVLTIAFEFRKAMMEEIVKVSGKFYLKTIEML